MFGNSDFYVVFMSDIILFGEFVSKIAILEQKSWEQTQCQSNL